MLTATQSGPVVVAIDQAKLVESLRYVASAAGDSTSRYRLAVVQLRRDGKELVLTATDGRRMHCARLRAYFDSDARFDLLLPTGEVRKVLKFTAKKRTANVTLNQQALDSVWFDLGFGPLGKNQRRAVELKAVSGRYPRASQMMAEAIADVEAMPAEFGSMTGAAKAMREVYKPVRAVVVNLKSSRSGLVSELPKGIDVAGDGLCAISDEYMREAIAPAEDKEKVSIAWRVMSGNSRRRNQAAYDQALIRMESHPHLTALVMGMDV